MMIHIFRDMSGNLSLRKNIYVLIDEAHRTTGGEFGNFLMAALLNATFIGFIGTPVDKTACGKSTFKTFGREDNQGYMHKYSIADTAHRGTRSIAGRHSAGRPRSGEQHRGRHHATTLLLSYQLAPNETPVPHETLDKEFLSLAEAEGVADIKELNKILGEL